ncbi:MAG: complex I subunit 5 family protein [Eubacteriales bacterium]|nr:complex I subunit 5 family protein [Eubacteriales bacterium]
MNNMLLPFLAFWPLAAAVLSFLAGRRSKKARDLFVKCALAAELIAALKAFSCAEAGLDWVWEGFCGMGLHLHLDGFRAVYVLIAGFMWLMTGLFSGDYFAHHYHNRNRYYFFTLLTMCGTVGMFLSASLYSAFIFFEVMSMASYAWVAHDEKSGAMRAAQTYLAVAVIGGMVTLMGMFLLYAKIGTLEFAEIYRAAEAVSDKKELYLIGALIAFGFAAKAGAFPMHIWLPKAHPVAPAPASALLSGILTKTGIFGILVISCEIFAEDTGWGNALLVFGEITMFLGALLALFSVDLKRTLACSSMSQIGFILIGVGCRCLLGHHGALAGYGTVMHMINHSLIKLVLFQCAGAVYMRLHKLNLNDIRGFGRRKPLLNIAFLIGALGIMGVPLLNGYISKSLLHEGIVEYIHIAPHALHGAYKAAEWVFLISGGMTAAYMTKLYICLFVEKNADEAEQKRFDAMGGFGWKTNVALLCSAAVLPVMGMLPEATLQKAGEMSLHFLHLHAPEHAIEYFSWVNLQGAIISLSIGAALYLGVVRPLLMKKGADGRRVYVDRWPAGLDMEDGLYRPLLEKVLPAVLGALGKVGDNLAEFVLRYILRPVSYFVTRAADEAVDSAAVLLMETVFKSPRQEHAPVVGNHLTHALGVFVNGCKAVLNCTVRRRRPIETDFVALFAAWRDEMNDTARRVTRSVSFGLLLLCVTMYIIFTYLLSR